MIQDKINKILPYIEESFITYNLAEYGNYTPFVNFWTTTLKPFEKNNERHENWIELFKSKGYEINEEYRTQKISGFTVCPIFIHRDNGTILYRNENWSIEEMLDLIHDVLA